MDQCRYCTRAKVEPDTTEEVVGGEAVVIPYGQFETPLLEVIPRDILKNECVVPLWITVTSDYGALTL